MAALLAFYSIKGGSGKTTLAFNMAERAASAGARVILLDCDYQEASLSLAMARQEFLGECWPVRRCEVSLAGAGFVRSLSDGGRYDLVICDLPRSQSMMLGGFLSAMDLVLAPVGVGAINVVAASGLLDLVQGLRAPAPTAFVLNGFPRGRPRVDALIEEIESRGGEVCPVAVPGRVAHLDMFYDGKGVCEKSPGSPAALEMDGLWRWTARRLGLDAFVPAGG